MRFAPTREYIEMLRRSIRADGKDFIQNQLKDLYPADIAEIFNELEPEEAKKLYTLLDEQTAPDVLPEMEESVRERFLASLTSKEIAEQFIDNMASDDAADVIAELPETVQGEVLSHMEDTEQASDIADLLAYGEDTAGGLMVTELIRVHISSNIMECVRDIRAQAEQVETFYTVYVVDDEEKLTGLLSLKKLLITPSLHSLVKEIYNPKVISVNVNTPGEEVANIMDKYDLVVLPVVDDSGRLVGRITIDDVVDYIRKEDTEDVQKMGAVEALNEPYISIPLLQMIRKRAGWLVILFLGETLTASAMGFFEDQIAKAVVLALFVPLIISSGGNSGSQAATLVIRALALGEITISDWWHIIRRELAVGLALGLMLGIIGFLRVAVWSQFTDVYGPHAMQIANVVGITLTGVVIWGTLVGSVLPLALKRAGLDPAVSSAPFIATLVDVTGLIIYFTISALFLRGLLM